MRKKGIIVSVVFCTALFVGLIFSTIATAQDGEKIDQLKGIVTHMNTQPRSLEEHVELEITVGIENFEDISNIPSEAPASAIAVLIVEP